MCNYNSMCEGKSKEKNKKEGAFYKIENIGALSCAKNKNLCRQFRTLH